MLRFIRLFFLVGCITFQGPTSYALAQPSLEAASHLRMPNAEQVRIDRQPADKNKPTPEDDSFSGEPTKVFRGVQTDTLPGSIDQNFSHPTSNRLYNTNRDQTWEGMGSRGRGQKIPFSNLKVFGSSLFNGNFSGTYYDERNPEYKIRFGDRVGVRVWGVFNFEQTLNVDRLGNIFIPSVGPVNVAGVPNKDLAETVRKAIDKVYSSNYYDSYIDLATSQPMSVFVSGYVNSPGRYAGGVTDSVLFFLDLAGGIDPERGSYREIEVVRKGVTVAVADLYKFLLEGRLDGGALQDGDVIVAKRRGIRVGVNGHVRTQAWFEFRHNAVSGREVMACADPLPGVSHVSVLGYRNRVPLKKYLTLKEFKNFPVYDNDTIEFIYDQPSDAITIYADGALNGRSQFFVKKGTRLNDVLNYIEVDKSYSDVNSIYLRRYDVAKRQATALQESLFRLEQNALTSSSSSVDEATIRVKEAELINQFVERAKRIQPQGVVPISNNGVIKNVYLQDGDIIVVPSRSDVVLTSGEVVVPNAVVFNAKYSVENYIAMSGGFSNKADQDNIILFKADGHIGNARTDRIEAGDSIMALPKYESKNLQFAKDLTQIFFQVAVGTRALVDIF